MSFSLFINFDGNCKQAVDYYAGVFKSEVKGLMTFDQMPADPGFAMKDEDKQRVAYAEVKIFGTNIMFCDYPSGMPLVVGNNLSPTLGGTDAEEIRRAFAELKIDGEVGMDLQKTFWSELYGSVTDKYGVIWQFSLDGENM